MAEIEVIKEQPKNNRSLCMIMAIISCFVSAFVGGFSIYLSILGNFWFIVIALCFISQSILFILPLTKKDDYSAMKMQGIAQVIRVIVMMPYLLFMILWNDPDGLMDYSFITYLLFGIALIVNVSLFFTNRLIIKKNYHPLLNAYANQNMISACILLILIELTIVNYFEPGASNALFDNLLQEKPLWIYIIDILLNAGLTIFVALLALSTLIRSQTKEELSTTNQIKHTIKWFNDHEVGMFVGLLFTLYLAVLSLINMKQSFFYILMFAYYVGNALIRIINYLWHQRIVKKCGDNQIKENRKSSWILLFNAFTYLLFSNVLVVAAFFMMLQKVDAGANIYLFLFFIVPMALFRFVSANKNIKKNRKENNTYKLGISLIGLVNVFFTILEVVAISFHGLSIVWIRYVFIILAIIAVKIAVIIVAFIFVIHWLRSIILNRKSKERKYLKEKGM